jgi:glutaconate CoA-transferase subunit B
MAVLDFEPDSKRMRVFSIHPGFCFDDVQQNCGFELLKADTVQVTDPPADEELDILRHQVDPYGYVIGRG